MTKPVINELTDIILHAIAEWDAEYDDTDLTIRIRTEILKRFELTSIEDNARDHR